MNAKAKTAAIALFVIAGVLLVTLFTHGWFGSDESGGVGLTGIQRCMNRGCEARMWFSLPQVPGSILMLALLGLGAGFAAVGLAAHTAIMLTRGTPTLAKTSGANLAFGISIFAFAMFLIRLTVERHSGLHVSWAGILAILAAVAGLVVIQVLVKPLAGEAARTTVYAPPEYAMAQRPQPIPAFPLSMQLGMNRMHGHLFLAPGRLYFICTKTGGAWAAAIGGGLGGALGMVAANALTTHATGAPVIYDEAQLYQAATTMPNSVVMQAPDIQEIKQTAFWRLIKVDNKKYGLPNGLGRDLKAAIGPWARHHQVRTVGFV